VNDFLSGLWFIAINLRCTRNLPVPRVRRYGHFVMRTLTTADIGPFTLLHNQLRPDKPLSAWRRWLYTRAGSKLVWVVETATGHFVGFTMHYFREGEWRRGIVHNAFISVSREYRGRGLGGALQAAAVEGFAAGGMKGVSTQVDRANPASLRMFLRQGFREAGVSDDGKLQLLRRL